ncbi:MAG TPA: phosphate ABC transporter permease family protein, partial [Rhizobiaceae bacterium]|nr:phosphate ABC transporter permease family protein [Rhizobiaceae bacterium]
MLFYVLLLLALATAVAAIVSYAKAKSAFSKPGEKSHSRPIYHALNAAIWTGVPAFVFLIVWLFINDNIINAIAVSQVPGIESMDASQRGIILSEIRQAADGKAFVEIRPEVAVAAES